MIAGGTAILVVDDEAEFLATYQRLLGRDGFRVVAAPSLATAFAALGRERFAVLIADLRLPDGDGLDLVREARTTTPPTRTIVVSGAVTAATRAAVRSAGAEFIAKPFDATALAARVRELANPAPAG